MIVITNSLNAKISLFVTPLNQSFGMIEVGSCEKGIGYIKAGEVTSKS